MSSKNKQQTTLHLGERVTLTPTEVAQVTDTLTTFRKGGDLADLATSAASTGASRLNRSRKDQAIGRVFSAVGVQAALQSGYIGGENGVTLKAYGERYGHSPSNMTALKNLGAALAKGFGPDFPEWPILSDKAGNKAYRKAVEDAKDAEGIAEAIRTLSKPKTGTARPDEGGKGKTDSDAGQTGPEVDTLTPFEAAKAAVGILRDTMPTLDREQFSVVEDMLTNMLAGVLSARVEAEQAA